jgi:hypothetical protein
MPGSMETIVKHLLPSAIAIVIIKVVRPDKALSLMVPPSPQVVFISC